MFQRVHVQHVQKDSVSDASRLLGLDGLAVDWVELDAFGGRVAHVVTADQTASACPSCGVFSVSVKGLVSTHRPLKRYGEASARHNASEVFDGSREPIIQRHGRTPLQEVYSAVDVGSSADRVVGRQRVVFDGAAPAD